MNRRPPGEVMIAVIEPMRAPLNMAQLTLGCALGLEARNRDFDWRSGHPGLVQWFERFAARPSFAATAPPRP